MRRASCVALFLAAVCFFIGTASAAAATAGSYSGGSPQLLFYVSANGTQVQDVSIPFIQLPCTHPNSAPPTDHLFIAATKIELNGEFTANKTQKGVIKSRAATFKYTFSGQLVGTSATGTYREEIIYNDGEKHNCTGGTKSWSATLDSQPPQTSAAPQPGSYAGTSGQNGQSVPFAVSADSKLLQELAIPFVTVECVPAASGTELTQEIKIPSMPVKMKTTFTAKQTRSGMMKGFPATFTETFTGHFHGLNNAGKQRAAGTLREDIVYNDGVEHSCSSNAQTWTATHT